MVEGAKNVPESREKKRAFSVSIELFELNTTDEPKDQCDH